MSRQLSPLLRSGLHRGSSALAGLLLAASCAPLPAQKPATAPAQTPSPAPLAPATPVAAAARPSAAPKPVDFSQEALVFDQLHTHIRMEADGTGTRETTARIRIQSDAGVKAMAVLTFTYTAQNQQVDIAYVRVVKPDGSVVVTPDYNVQDLPADITREAPMYSDIHQKHVAVRGLGVGDILEYKMTLRTLKAEVPGQFWDEYTFEKNLIVLDEQLTLDLPADKTVTVASADVQPTVATANGRKLYHWVSSNLKRPDPEHPKSTKHWKPSVQITTFTSWQQIGAWYQTLQQQALTVTPAIQSRVDTLTKGLTSPDDKLQAIFNDVALNIHYIGLEFGIGRYQPHNADDVLANEYGDCKDKHTLLATMLKAAGITAWPVLINSSRELDADTPSPGQFDHVITIVPFNGKLLWMDSTEEVAPIGTLAGTLRDKQALAIPPDKPAYLIRTPADLPYAQRYNFTVVGKLSDQGQFTGHIVQSFRGDVGMLIRAAFRATPESQWKQLVQTFSNATGFAGLVATPTVSPIDQIAQPFTLSYDYTRDKFGEWDSHRISPPFPPTGWRSVPGAHIIKPADDVDTGSPGTQDFRATVQLPTGWTMSPTKGIDLIQPWAEYHSTYTFKDGTYTAERRLVIKQDKVPLADWDKYLAFRQAVYKDETWMTGVRPTGVGLVYGGVVPEPFQGVPDSGQFGIRAQVTQAIEPVRNAAAILDADKQPSQEDASIAGSTCQQMVYDTETKSVLLSPTDPQSLYWSQALEAAWTCIGWADILNHESGAADIYLRAAWQIHPTHFGGYLYARALEIEGKNASAARIYELASAADAQDPFNGLIPLGNNLDTLISEGYKRVTGRILKHSELNHGAYDGSLQSELDAMQEIRPLVRSTKLTGSALFALAFEQGKPTQVIFLEGDKYFRALESALKTHHFPSQLPSGSKARLLREVRVICSPWAGCDAYLLSLSSLQMPGTVIHLRPIQMPTPSLPAGSKVVEIPVAPPALKPQ